MTATAASSLPARPSLESLRKQAKKLARGVAAGETAAIARVAQARVQLPPAGGLHLSQRNAQLVLAREYGFAGWRELVAEVSRRTGRGLEWAAAEARRLIHDDDVERLKDLLAEHPALLSWHGAGGAGSGHGSAEGGSGERLDDGDGSESGLLGFAAGSFGDSFEPDRERNFTRPACAELLIDAGAVVMPAVLDGLIESRARGLLQLFDRKGLLPRTLRFAAALGDRAAVAALLDQAAGDDLAAVNEAFRCACRFAHEAVAALLLERSIALDPALGRRAGEPADRVALVRYLIAERSLDFVPATAAGPWQALVMERVLRAIHDGDLTAFVHALQREPWLLDEGGVGFQVGLVERATLRHRQPFIAALLELQPALLRCQPPSRSQAIEFAITYGNTDLIPLLRRIWTVPDDLPHAAGLGDLARVERWFDAAGAPALGRLEQHFPCNSPRARRHLQWGAPSAQQVLDTALAWSVINRHFDVARFLLEHGADIDTTWSSHEPASILHELVMQGNYESMRFLVERGIDMTIRDYRWNATAQGWARYAAHDEAMARWLAEEEEKLRGQAPTW